MMRLCFLIALSASLQFLQSEEIPIEIEIAKTHAQRTWGLMNRTSMPENQGMLFYYPAGTLWMFNTKMDLSAAFLDEDGRIIEITELKAYPEMMDPKRPVNNLNDFRKYPMDDKILEFFREKGYPIPLKSKYLLEMNKDWFKRHEVNVGDVVIWNESSTKAYIKR